MTTRRFGLLFSVVFHLLVLGIRLTSLDMSDNVYRFPFSHRGDRLPHLCAIHRKGHLLLFSSNVLLLCLSMFLSFE